MAPKADPRFERLIAAGMERAFDDRATEEQELDLDTARLIVFSDLHKGTRDDADDFRRSERAYQAALGSYLERGHRLFVLGDVEELWKYSPEPVLGAYADSLKLEQSFHDLGRYERFWGNHDDLWCHPGAVTKRLGPVYTELQVREALKLRVTSNGETLGLIFFVHGHQGTLESERYAWCSKHMVRYVWRPLQRKFGVTATTPARDWDLRQRHEEAMFDWARSHPEKPVLIAGHTHRPVFGSTRPEPNCRPIGVIEADLRLAEAKRPPGSKRIVRLRGELEWAQAEARYIQPAPIPIEPPCYFNTGCCCYPDGDVTGLEIADGMIRLVRWPTDDEKPAAKVLAEADLRKVLAAVGGQASSGAGIAS